MEQEILEKKVPKEITKEIFKKILKNMIFAIVVVIYFISCSIIYAKLGLKQMELITKGISGGFLLSSLIVFEIAYKKDSGTLTMTAIELLIVAVHAMFIYHIINVYNLNFNTYLLASVTVLVIYYVVKATIIYTRARIKYLKSLSDISEIVKDKPVVKEAKKRKEESNKEDNAKSKSKKKQTTNKKGKIKEGTIDNNSKKEGNEDKKVTKTKSKTKQDIKKDSKETKSEQIKEIQGKKENKKAESKEEIIEQVKPKSKRGRKKKEGDKT